MAHLTEETMMRRHRPGHRAHVRAAGILGVSLAILCAPGDTRAEPAASESAPAQMVATYVVHQTKTACVDHVAVGPLFYGPPTNLTGPSAEKQAHDACKMRHSAASCRIEAKMVGPKSRFMAIADTKKKCYDGSETTTIGIGFGESEEAAWKDAVVWLGHRNWAFDAKRDPYGKRELRALAPPPPAPAPAPAADPLSWACADGVPVEIAFRPQGGGRVLHATRKTGATVTTTIKAIIDSAYQLEFGQCYERQKLAELGSLTCPVAPTPKKGQKIIQLDVSADTVAAALNGMLCPGEAPSPGLAVRTRAVLMRMLKEIQEDICKRQKCEPKLIKATSYGGTRW